jgi:hypothetical protein
MSRSSKSTSSSPLFVQRYSLPKKDPLTSLVVTGFPIKVKDTSFLNPANGSKSANSVNLFFVRTSVARFGMLVEMFGWIFEMRFCARNNVRRRGWRGKLPSCAMSLSVRSMASLS